MFHLRGPVWVLWVNKLWITVCICLCQSVCGWTDWLSYSQTLFMLGMLLGSLFGGSVSDR